MGLCSTWLPLSRVRVHPCSAPFPTVQNDGLSAQQQSALWGCRVLLIIATLLNLGGAHVSSVVAMQGGSRLGVHIGIAAYASAGAYLARTRSPGA